jgi:hypothetical protein
MKGEDLITKGGKINKNIFSKFSIVKNEWLC